MDDLVDDLHVVQADGPPEAAQALRRE